MYYVACKSLSYTKWFTETLRLKFILKLSFGSGAPCEIYESFKYSTRWAVATGVHFNIRHGLTRLARAVDCIFVEKTWNTEKFVETRLKGILQVTGAEQLLGEYLN